MTKTPTKQPPAARKRAAASSKPRKRATAEAATQEAAPAPREKRVRGTFALPGSDYALIARLKEAGKQAGRPTKKNELLRAGLRALDAMDTAVLLSALNALPPVREKKKA